MRPNIRKILLICIMSLFAITINAGVANDIEQMETMRKTLQTHGLMGFFEVTKTNGWEMPFIYSQWYVDRLPREPADKVRLEQSKRDFGFAFSQAFDNEGLSYIPLAGSTVREKRATQLLDIAEWIREQRGYGNSILASRAENMAYVQIGYLVADINYPTNKIDALIVRASSVDDDEKFRLDALNSESPEIIRILRLTENQLRRNDMPEDAWETKIGRTHEWNRVHQVDSPDNTKLPDKYQFFVFDDNTGKRPYTSTVSWNDKMHNSVCARTMMNIQTRHRVDTLYTFRKTIGYYPEPAPPQWGYSALETAFQQEWDRLFRKKVEERNAELKRREEERQAMPFVLRVWNMLTQEEMPHIEWKIGESNAGSIYEGIVTGRLCDYDTAQLSAYIRENQSKDSK